MANAPNISKSSVRSYHISFHGRKASSITESERDSILEAYNQRNGSREQFCVKAGITEAFLKKIQNKKMNHKPLRQETGRPALITEEIIDSVKTMAESQHYKFSVDEIRSKIDESIETNYMEAGKIINKDPTRKFLHSRTTFDNILEKIDGKIAMAETTTDARYTAERDVLNAISLACTNGAMDGLSNPHMIVNADATQFNVGGTETNVQVVYTGKRSEVTGSLKVFPENRNANSLAFFIKYYMIITAAGDCAPPIYIIQDPHVPKDDMDVHKVNGLGFNGRTYGYLIFSNSRVPNASFYEWVLIEVMIPMIEEKRSMFPTVCEDKLGWLQLDGELQQINIFTDPEIQSILHDARIEVGKLPASYTAIGQPCDVGKQFKAVKAVIKHLDESTVAWNEGLIKNIEEAYDKHNRTYGGSDRTTRISSIIENWARKD